MKRLMGLFIFIILVSVCYGEIYDAMLVENKNKVNIISKTYDERIPAYYSDLGKFDTELLLYTNDLCKDLCLDNDLKVCTGDDNIGCSSYYYICSAYRLGKSIIQSSTCGLPTLKDSDWTNQNNIVYTTDSRFIPSSSPYPGQLFLVLSNDTIVDINDEFYLIDAHKDKGWLKGQAPETLLTEDNLHSYDLIIKIEKGLAKIFISNIYDDQGRLIDVKTNNQHKVIVGVTYSKNILDKFIDSKIVSPNEEITFNIPKDAKDRIYVFVNGILEGSFIPNQPAELRSDDSYPIKIPLNKSWMELYDENNIPYNKTTIKPTPVEQLVTPETPAVKEPESAEKEIALPSIRYPQEVKEETKSYKWVIIPSVVSLIAVIAILFLFVKRKNE